MRKAKNVKVGDVIQFPRTHFAPFRRGWDGWLFSAGIVEKLYTAKGGTKYAIIRFCTRRAGRYQLLPNTEAEKIVNCEYLFEYDLEFAAKYYKYFKAIEDSGEQVCWSEDIALLVNHGLI